jgi:CheY-like chemotaxis protein/nitrogen-specific signal transduction histidine kinase
MILLPLWIFSVALVVILWQGHRLRVARRVARAANAAKSDFVANMSHELRTPLNGILGTLNVLSQTGLNSPQREMLGIIRHSSEALLSMIDTVLEFASIEAGQVRLESAGFALRESIETVVDILNPAAAARGLRLEVIVAEAIPCCILGDAARLRRVLFNLSDNAIKFTEAGTVRLEVALAGDGQALSFRVKDTGIGIAPEAGARLFTPFTQADSASSRRYGGFGLGLATARRLVQLMGGSIGLESVPGRGSVFWFLLPLIAAPVEDTAMPAENETHSEAPLSGQGLILVVDDNPVNQLVAARVVNQLGYATEVASGGEPALEAMARTAFDAILMDCQMPVMDGYQTTAEIRRREGGRRHTPIIAVTANTAEGNLEKCLASGMDDFLSKPIRPAALQAALRRWGNHATALVGSTGASGAASPLPPFPKPLNRPNGH